MLFHTSRITIGVNRFFSPRERDFLRILSTHIRNSARSVSHLQLDKAECIVLHVFDDHNERKVLSGSTALSAQTTTRSMLIGEKRGRQIGKSALASLRRPTFCLSIFPIGEIFAQTLRWIIAAY